MRIHYFKNQGRRASVKLFLILLNEQNKLFELFYILRNTFISKLQNKMSVYIKIKILNTTKINIVLLNKKEWMIATY